MAEEPQASQYIQASNNSIAVGKVSVGGNVNENFLIGNNNQVSSKKKKYKYYLGHGY